MTLNGYIGAIKGNTGTGISSVYQNADYTITITLTDGTSVTTDPIPGFTEIELDENYDLVVTKTDGTQETVDTDLGTYRSTLEGYKTDAATSASSAATSAVSGSSYALKAEGFAVGKQNGTTQISGSYYHNNAQYYNSQATVALSHAVAASSNAATAASSAATSASSAFTSASSAYDSQVAAEGFAIAASSSAAVLENCSATATTLSAGTSATASYASGVFSFGIPKGADGSLASGVLAPTYSSSSTYAVGDYVYYSGDLYRCITAITTAEAWTAGHWTQVALGDEVADANDDVGYISDALVNDSGLKTPLTLDFTVGVVHNGAYNAPYAGETITAYSLLFEKRSTPVTVHIDIANGYKCLVVNYSSDSDTSSVTSAWLPAGSNVYTDTGNAINDNYFCIEIRKTDNTDITKQEADAAVTAYYSDSVLPNRKKVLNITQDSTARLDVTESIDIFGNGHTINVGLNDIYGMYIEGDNGVVVNVYDLTIKGGTADAVRVTHYATANFYNCHFEDGAYNGLGVVNGNTNCFGCVAQNNGTDGFNYHNDGMNTAIGCYGLNNGDDGISNHENSTLKIVGGKYNENAKAGIACPTYGATETDISDVYCLNNSVYGILIHNDSQTTEEVVIQNAIIKGSPTGLRVSGYQVITNGVKYSGCTTNKDTANGGTITEL